MRKHVAEATLAAWRSEYAAGSSFTDIARRHDTTVPAVRGRLARAGVALRPADAESAWGRSDRRFDAQVSGYAHRYAWERQHGAITDDLTVDHLCRVRNCVNTDHMELVDGVTNYLRGVDAKTLCLNKLHEWIDENIYEAGGKKFCYPCKLATGQRNWRRKSRMWNGLPNRRFKFNEALRDEIVQECIDGKLTVKEAAEKLGCRPKYMDKRVRNASRAQGMPDRKQLGSPKLPAKPPRADLETHCANGHRWDEDNNLYEWRGQRQCRRCKREVMQRRRDDAVSHDGGLYLHDDEGNRRRVG